MGTLCQQAVCMCLLYFYLLCAIIKELSGH